MAGISDIPGQLAAVAGQMRRAVNQGFNTIRAVIGTEIRRGYDAMNGGDAFFPLDEEEALEPITTSRRVLNVVLFFVGLSPVFWGAVLAFFAHNLRATIEAIKTVVNSAYESKHPQFTMHPEPSSGKAAIRVASFPGMVIGTILGSIATVLWVNLAAIPYTIAGMARLGFKGQFAGVYDDHLTASARHGVGFVGTAIGWVIGLVPFFVLGFSRILQNSLYSFFAAVTFPVRGMVKAWEGKTHGRRFGLKEMNTDMLRVGRTPANPRTASEAYGLGAPGTVLGTIVGLLPAAVMGIVGTLYYFVPSLLLAFKSVYNTVASDYWSIKATPTRRNKEAYTAGQRYGYGWLGTLVGGLVAVTIAIPTVLIRTVINSARLFVSVSQGLINLTFGREPSESFGFDNKDKKTNRWGFGLPGTILAAIVVGIPCAVIKGLYYLGILAVVALGAILLPLQRMAKQFSRWASNDQLFSPRNSAEHNPIAEYVMHRMFAALDASGDLQPGEIAHLTKEQAQDGAYTFGVGKNLVKFLRKVTINLEFDTDMEALLKDMLKALRAAVPTRTNNLVEITSENIAAVARVMVEHCEKTQKHPIHSNHEKDALTAKIQEVCYQVARELFQEARRQHSPAEQGNFSRMMRDGYRALLQQHTSGIDMSQRALLSRLVDAFVDRQSAPLQIGETPEAQWSHSFYRLLPPELASGCSAHGVGRVPRDESSYASSYQQSSRPSNQYRPPLAPQSLRV